MKPIATLLLVLNFCMYVIVLGIGAWAMNRAIDHGFIIGKKEKQSLFCVFLISSACLIILLKRSSCRSRFKTSCSFFTRVLPNGECCNWILCDICYDCWSSWCCISNFRNQSYPFMDCWKLAICSFSCYHGLDSYTLGHGVIYFLPDLILHASLTLNQIMIIKERKWHYFEFILPNCVCVVWIYWSNQNLILISTALPAKKLSFKSEMPAWWDKKIFI